MLHETQEIIEAMDPNWRCSRWATVKVEIEEDDILANGELDQLIREDLISAEMVASLGSETLSQIDLPGRPSE